MMPRILVLLALGAWLIMLLPYPAAAFMAGGVACFSLPFYRWLRDRFSQSISVAAYSSALSLCVLTPLAVLSVLIAPQILAGARRLNMWRHSGLTIPPELAAHIEHAKEVLTTVPGVSYWLDEIGDDVYDIINYLAKFLVTGAVNIAGNTVAAIWMGVLFIILTVLAVVHAHVIYKITLRLTQLPEDSLQRFIAALRSAFRAVFVGILLIATIQGVFCGIGFWLMGVPEPAFWGLLATILAAIPIVGPALLWLPMAMVLWLTGSPYVAVGISVWCFIVVVICDYLVRPYLLKTGIKASAIVLLLSIVCGIAAFGPVGLIVGPVLIAFAHQAMQESDLFAKQKQEPGKDT
jgi:predicted PurR-regulated permease PerM